MSVARIQCRCGAYGFGSAIDVGFGQAEIVRMPDEWENNKYRCRHTEKTVESVEVLSGSEADQEYESSGL